MTIVLLHKINTLYLVIIEEELEVRRPEPDTTIATINVILILAVMITV
jgi:hypothetical protein